jgi:hypothetical protein
MAGAVGGLVAGITGMAASQEVKAEDDHVDDMMYLHGVGNLLVVGASLGMAFWRRRNRPTVASSALGIGAVGAAVYTAYLGGEMVYSHGLGIKAMPYDSRQGVGRSPALFSAQAIPVILADAIRGITWLGKRTAEALSGRKAIPPAAFGITPPPTQTLKADDNAERILQ